MPRYRPESRMAGRMRREANISTGGQSALGGGALDEYSRHLRPVYSRWAFDGGRGGPSKGYPRTASLSDRAGVISRPDLTNEQNTRRRSLRPICLISDR